MSKLPTLDDSSTCVEPVLRRSALLQKSSRKPSHDGEANSSSGCSCVRRCVGSSAGSHRVRLALGRVGILRTGTWSKRWMLKKRSIEEIGQKGKVELERAEGDTGGGKEKGSDLRRG